MQTLLNTLFITTQGAYLHTDHDTLRVEVEGKTQLQVPAHHIGAIVCFGNVLISPWTFHRSARDGRPITLLDRNGQFGAQVEGPLSGNVLLRQAQHQAANDPDHTWQLARQFVAGKIQNSRLCLLRSARDAATGDAEALQAAAKHLARSLRLLEDANDLEVIRGLEGDAARAYFGVFDRMIRDDDRDTFRFVSRSRRPPRDAINALLSFIYTLLTSDCKAAAQGIGLDHQIGFLHAVRPGRPAMALDLMEEFRSVFADRLAITLINRRQITGEDFAPRPGGAVYLSDTGRKQVLVAYQKRKQQVVTHPLLEQQVPLGLIPHLQARLLARHLRGDVPAYPPYVHR
ncbi:MAG: type I-C CRISPR-associated endonuclease Cas1 [Candidatus Sericytochromatia bacterium]|nr:type I-C CRISPR-associated endonuclease Cas1 [Candidatus Sericytochromatia bacterium]